MFLHDFHVSNRLYETGRMSSPVNNVINRNKQHCLLENLMVEYIVFYKMLIYCFFFKKKQILIIKVFRVLSYSIRNTIVRIVGGLVLLTLRRFSILIDFLWLFYWRSCRLDRDLNILLHALLVWGWPWGPLSSVLLSLNFWQCTVPYIPACKPDSQLPLAESDNW